MMKLSTKRTMAMALTLALTAGTVLAPAADSTAAAKPGITAAVSMKVGAEKKLSITKNGFTIKNVSAKSGNKSIVSVTDTSLKKVYLKAKALGATTVTTTVKAKKGKTTKSYKLKTSVTVKDATPSTDPTADPTTPTIAPVNPTAAPVNPTTAPSGSIIVGTQAELENALHNGYTSITIGSAALTLTIPTGTYKNVALVINAPYAGIVNYAEFKSIVINTVSSYTEYGNNNNITVASNKSAAVNIFTNGTVQSLNIVPAGDATAHRIDIRSGVINTMNLYAGTKATVSTSGTAIVARMNADNACNVDLSMNNTSMVQSFFMKGSAQASINGNPTRHIIVDLTDATTAARVNVYSAIVDRVSTKEATIPNAEYVVINRTTTAITNYVTRTNGSTYMATIQPGNTGVETLTATISSADAGNNYIIFYCPSYLKLDDTRFEFTLRTGSTAGTVVNTSKTVTALSSVYYYQLTLNQPLQSGTYYLTMQTSLAYQLAPLSFTINSSTINFTQNNLTAGSTVGYTKVIGIDTSSLQYIVNNSPSIPNPSSVSWSNFPSNNEVAMELNQYIHVRAKNGTTQIASVPVNNAARIKGEAERIAANGTIDDVIYEATVDGGFTQVDLTTRSRWSEVAALIDEADGRIQLYTNVGGNPRTLVNYARYQTLVAQFDATSDTFIVDANYPGSGQNYNIGSDVNSMEDAINRLKTSPLVPKDFTGITGSGEIVTISITAWQPLVGATFDKTSGNWFRMLNYAVAGRKTGYYLADEASQTVQVHASYVD